MESLKRYSLVAMLLIDLAAIAFGWDANGQWSGFALTMAVLLQLVYLQLIGVIHIAVLEEFTADVGFMQKQWFKGMLLMGSLFLLGGIHEEPPSAKLTPAMKQALSEARRHP